MVVGLVIVVYAFLAWFMHKRPSGRELYATGSNPEAARLAGIRVNRLTFLSYLTIGVLVGLAGLIYVGRVGVVASLERQRADAPRYRRGRRRRHLDPRR